MLKGKAHKFGDGISTDHIIPGRYAHLRSNLPELAKHVLEDADVNFVKKVKPGDFVVGGSNFGLGSSREHAPTIMKLAGLNAVLAKSFARIFFRNAINLGFPLIICDTDRIQERDELEVDLERGIVGNRSRREEIPFTPLPSFMVRILNDGGLFPHIQKHKGFQIE